MGKAGNSLRRRPSRVGLELRQDASLMEVIVPDGVTPGTTIEVFVPDGVIPGSASEPQTRGKSFTLVVPEGATPGTGLVFSTGSERPQEDANHLKRCCTVCDGRQPSTGEHWRACSGCTVTHYCSRSCQRSACAVCAAAIRQATPAALTQALVYNRGDLPRIEACLVRALELMRQDCDDLVQADAAMALVGAVRAHSGSQTAQHLGCACLARLAAHNAIARAAVRAAGGAEAALAACRTFPNDEAIAIESSAVLHGLIGEDKKASWMLWPSIGLVLGAGRPGVQLFPCGVSLDKLAFERSSLCWRAGGLAAASLVMAATVIW